VDLQIATLCEAVTIRDGLLYILGGGVACYSPMWYPAPLQIALAVLIELDYLDQGEPHKFAIALLDHQAHELERIEGEFALVKDIELDAVATLPAALPLAGMSLPVAGNYEVRLEIDQETRARLPLRAAATS
jgi:hypothetical protein